LQFYILFLITLLMTAVAQSQQFKVNQIKGHKAIIEMLNGDILNPGETYTLQNDENTQYVNQKLNIKKNQRNNLIGLSASIFSSKNDLSNSTTQTIMDINGRYGWNKSIYEYGLIGLFGYIDSGSLKTTSFGFGGFGTYNLNENKPGTDFLFALDTSLTYLISKNTNASQSYDDSYLSASAGPFAKWFMLSNDFSVNAGFVYTYTAFKAGLASASSYNTHKFAINAGIANYF